MKTLETFTEGKYKAIIKKTPENRFFVQCTQDDRATHAFPFKYYGTLTGATKYAKKFLALA